MEDHSPLQCPSTVTIRRNPHRKARATPLKTTAIKASPPKDLNNVPNFPLNEILSIDLQHQQQIPTIPSSKPSIPSDSLNVFLRIRPPPIAPSKLKQLKVKKPAKSCLIVNDHHSVTVSPPLCDSNRLKSEVYNGFSHVFSSHYSQDEVYEKLMRPVVEEFLNGRSGLLAALGPSGSGKTHTVFGSAKEPGLVPRVLRHIFQPDKRNPSRTYRFYLSIFEIYSEKGKGEKLSDLSPEGSDIHMQQSVVKGLKEILVKDVAQAESLLSHAKSKRVTAMTNSNSQSSRSQCIISIRRAVDEGIESNHSEAVLTFVDLAGAEREKKTGNKGGRLLESNFINNTSMVFGLCLRSLLEHQRNPKRPLQKHFQSSLLTRYLREYLEGRKRMSLILTVRSGEEDYFDTSSLLRQASPFMEIKFLDIEETSNLPQHKRRRQIIGSEHQKRAKLSFVDTRDEVGMTCRDSENVPKGISGGDRRNCVSRLAENSHLKDKCADSSIQRQYNVMKGFAKAPWAVLKQYKERVKTMQKDIDSLTENLAFEHAQNLVMEEEILNLKSQLSSPKQVLGVASCFTGGPRSGSRFSLEGLTSNEKNVSAEVPEYADIECKENEILHTVEEKCSSHNEGDLAWGLGMTRPEDPHKCPISESKATNLLWERDVQFEVEVGGTLTLEVGCPCTESEGRFDGIPDFKEESGLGSLESRSEELLEPEPANVLKVSSGDFPSGPTTSLSVDESVNLDATMTEASHGATLSLPQSYCEQQSLMECQISHDTSKDDFPEKIQRKECDEESTSGAANVTRSPFKDLIVPVENCGRDTPNKKEKENVAKYASCNGNKVSSVRETKEVSNSELEEKEVSTNSEPLKSGRPKRRLMPASSLLLRDAGTIDIAEENVKLRGGGGGRKLVEDEHKRTKGNAHLLRLLKNHLPR